MRSADAWRANDSLRCGGSAVGLDEATADHSTISRTRRLIDVKRTGSVHLGAGVLAEKGC